MNAYASLHCLHLSNLPVKTEKSQCFDTTRVEVLVFWGSYYPELELKSSDDQKNLTSFSWGCPLSFSPCLLPLQFLLHLLHLLPALFHHPPHVSSRPPAPPWSTSVLRPVYLRVCSGAIRAGGDVHVIAESWGDTRSQPSWRESRAEEELVSHRHVLQHDAITVSAKHSSCASEEPYPDQQIERCRWSWLINTWLWARGREHSIWVTSLDFS